MPLKPASMFACGCSLATGVKVILAFHLVACMLYLSATFCDMVLQMKSFGMMTSWSPLWQFSMIAFNMCGVPVILAAMYGISRHIDVAIRFYLGYLLIAFVINTVALIYMFILQGSDCTAPGNVGNAMVGEFGLAFMCGFLRILAYFFVSTVITMEVYCLYIVWSLCENISEASGPGIWSLLESKEHAFEKEKDHWHNDRNSNGHIHNGWAYTGEGPYADIAGLNHTKLPGAYPSPYGALEGVGFGEASPMFADKYAMSY